MQYQSYEIFRWWSNPLSAGGTFIIVGILKITAIIIQSRRLKSVSVCGLVAAWTFAGTSFAMSNVTTTIHLFCFAMAVISLGTLLEEMLE